MDTRTPRTDAVVLAGTPITWEVVKADFARTLELDLAAANERLRAERSLVIELIKRDALIDWAGGSTGSALGTRDRIVGALELFYECRAALAGKP